MNHKRIKLGIGFISTYIICSIILALLTKYLYSISTTAELIGLFVIASFMLGGLIIQIFWMLGEKINDRQWCKGRRRSPMQGAEWSGAGTEPPECGRR